MATGTARLSQMRRCPGMSRDYAERVRSDPARLRFEITARDGDARLGAPPHRPRGGRDAGVHPACDEGLRARASIPRRSPRSATRWCSATPTTCCSRRGPSGSRSSAACTASWAGIARSSPTRAASRSSRSPTARRRRGQGPARPRARQGGACSRSPRRGCASAPTATAPSAVLARVSMEVQAALGSDIALAFDECTPYHADREYTARSTERTHRWLERCLAGTRENGPERPGRVRDRPGRRPRGPAPRVRRRRSSAAGVDGLAIGGTLGRDKAEMHAVLELTLPRLPARRPSTCSASARSTTCFAGSLSASTLFDCAVPTRLARHGIALAPEPRSRFRIDLRKRGDGASDRAAARRGLPLPGLPRHDRDYLTTSRAPRS